MAIFPLLVVTLAGVLGGLLPLLKSWRPETLVLFIAFAAGTIMAASLIHMLPTAVEGIGPAASRWFFVGFLLLYALERFLIHPDEGVEGLYHQHPHVGLAAFLGLALHSLVVGIVLRLGLQVTALSWPLLVAVAGHQIPESFSLSTILLRESYPRRQVVLYALTLALMVPVGAILACLGVSESVMVFYGNHLLAMAAGMFLYVATTDLIPEMHVAAVKQSWVFMAFIVGSAVMMALRWLTH